MGRGRPVRQKAKCHQAKTATRLARMELSSFEEKKKKVLRFITFSLFTNRSYDKPFLSNSKAYASCRYYPNGRKRARRFAPSPILTKYTFFLSYLARYISPKQLNLNGPTKHECPPSIRSYHHSCEVK